MKVKVIKGPWKDFKEKVERNIGDEFICSKERFEEINKKLAKFGEGPWIKEVTESKNKK